MPADSHPNAQLVESFYQAFQRRDAEAMAGCYTSDIWFWDPVFHDLRGQRAGDMWRMLAARASGLEVTYSGIEADDKTGRAHWEAHYTFLATGNKVHNIIDATFEFRDGKICRHTDKFDFSRWAGQALGLRGKLLGWSSFLRNKVHQTALGGLEAFEAKRKAG
jgi:ketosteroid isomerase-like protein